MCSDHRSGLASKSWSWRARAKPGRCALPPEHGTGHIARLVVAHNRAVPGTYGGSTAAHMGVA